MFKPRSVALPALTLMLAATGLTAGSAPATASAGTLMQRPNRVTPNPVTTTNKVLVAVPTDRLHEYDYLYVVQPRVVEAHGIPVTVGGATPFNSTLVVDERPAAGSPRRVLGGELPAGRGVGLPELLAGLVGTRRQPEPRRGGGATPRRACEAGHRDRLGGPAARGAAGLPADGPLGAAQRRPQPRRRRGLRGHAREPAARRGHGARRGAARAGGPGTARRWRNSTPPRCRTCCRWAPASPPGPAPWPPTSTQAARRLGR